MCETPQLVGGGLAVDDRGSVAFVNGFLVNDYARFYVVRNHKAGFIRAWHGHKIESKAVCVLAGAAIVGVVKIDDWEMPSRDLPVDRYVLSGQTPSILKIPAGYANGFKTLTQETTLVFFSDRGVEESLSDDFRFSATYWDPWRVEER